VPVNRFIRELRRREVFRTAGLYVGVSWILIEVSSVMLPTFDAPEWMLRAIIVTAIVGFPVMLVLAWVYNLTDHGLEVQADSTDTIIAPLGSRKMDFTVIGVLTVALILSVYMNLTSGPKVIAELAPVSVLIADFDNRTGDPVFDGSLEQAIQIGIESAPFVNTYEHNAAIKVLSQLTPDSAVLNVDGSRLVAVREGIDVVLAGSIEADGPGYTIAVRMLSGSSGEIIADSVRDADSKLEVLAAIGTISGDLRKELGDDSVGHAEAGAVETFSAASLEAAQDYSQAQELARAGKHEEAVGLYESAVDKDPNFGRALSGWALSLFNLGRSDEATALWERALSKMATMTEREKFRTLGLYYMAVTGNYQKAIESYSALVEQYPADGPGHNNLAIAYFFTLEFEKARQHGGQLLEMYPTGARFKSNYALFAMYTGDFESAKEEAEQTLKLDENRYVAWVPIAMEAAARGDFERSRQAYIEMAESSQRGESVSSLGLADLAMFQGNYALAVELLLAGIGFDESIDNQRVMATKNAVLAVAQATLGHADAARQAADAALQDTGLARDVPVALLLASIGDHEGALQIAARLGEKLQSQSRAYGLMIEAAVDSALGDNVDAIDKLTAAIGMADLWLIRFHRGRAYLQGGFSAEAMDEFALCETRRGEATAVFLDDLPSWRYMATLPYWLGRAQLELGMTEAARQNLQSFIDSRSAGDAMAGDARGRLP
jgi:tetratricopeptide (TPR) repeat protein